MAQKRKVEVTAIDESDSALYSIFRNAANDLSQLYNQAVNQQKLIFEAGQKHALEKLKEWLAVKLREGVMVSLADVLAYLQHELNDGVPIFNLQQPCIGGSHQSGVSHRRLLEANQSFSSPVMQGQSTAGDAFHSQDLEMEINPED